MATFAKKSVTTKVVQARIKAIDSKEKKAPQDYLDLARNYLLLKDYDRALQSARTANSPQNKAALDYIAKISHEKGDHLEEVRALEILKLEDRPSPAFYGRLAEAYDEIGKKEEVIKYYRLSISEAPKYEKSYEGLYHYFLKKENFYDARLILIETIEKFGSKPKWLNEYCRMEIEQKYFDNAKNICQQAILASPKHAENHVYLALAFKYTEAEDQARKILFTAAKRFKKSEVTQREAGMMSQKINNYELSETHFGNCVKANPKAGDCFLELAKAQFNLKKYEDALNSFIKSCPFIKESELEIRKHAYELEKAKQTKLYQKYMDQTDKCQSLWFNQAKKAQ